MKQSFYSLTNRFLRLAKASLVITYNFYLALLVVHCQYFFNTAFFWLAEFLIISSFFSAIFYFKISISTANFSLNTALYVFFMVLHDACFDILPTFLFETFEFRFLVGISKINNRFYQVKSIMGGKLPTIKTD